MWSVTSRSCRGTGSSTCSSRWLGSGRTQPPSSWRRGSGAGLRGTPPRTPPSGSPAWRTPPGPSPRSAAPGDRDIQTTQVSMEHRGTQNNTGQNGAP